jgi:hypothetical protein
MAITTNIANGQQCPVAPLADEVGKLVEIYRALDEDATRNNDLLMSAVSDRIFGDIDRATLFKAESGVGALLQVVAAADLVDRFHDSGENGEVTKKKVFALLFSVAGYIEKLSGEKLHDPVQDYFMPKRHDPHAKMQEAFEFLDAKMIAAE